jgi:single-stranded-DNA-specific exonuclease
MPLSLSDSIQIQRRAIKTQADLGPQIPPLLNRIYAARGVAEASELHRALDGLPAPDDLPGTRQAASLLADALERGQSILIIGDFDCDGATSSALAMLVLGAMGARVDYLVPNRFEYGYGLTPEIVAVAHSRAPDWLLTVDNGIASVDGVAAANRLGMSVIVTDHHLPGEQLPDAAALVNPRLPGSEGFAGTNLAGVGVIFYVLVALRAELRQRDWFARQQRQPPNLAEYLDLVALGTVADVVILDRVNRILVHQGLQRMRAGRARPGIAALAQIAKRDLARITAMDLGFFIGPRLNAAGRLDDMSQGIECLLSDDLRQAGEMASQLDRLNRERRNIEEEMKEEAMAELQELLASMGQGLPAGLCLYQPHWHQGVIGILASRVKDRYHRPVIAFAPGDNGVLKGSARSVEGLHIRDALDAVASANPGLISKFGGHAMAAGLSLPQGAYETFAKAFDQEVRRHLDADKLHGVILSDGPLDGEEFNLELAASLREAGPWGQGFPEPIFDGEFVVSSCRVVGEKHLKLKLVHRDSDTPLEAIAFRQAEKIEVQPGDPLQIAYRLDINEYRGNVTLQLVVEYMEHAGVVA